MAAKPDRDTRNESFQCAVCALLQYYGSGVQLKDWMVFDFLEYPRPSDAERIKILKYVKDHTVIPNWCWSESNALGFYKWREQDEVEEEADYGEDILDTQARRGSQLDQWIKSCVYTAKALRQRNFTPAAKTYMFYHSTSTPFKDVAKRIINHIAKNAKDTKFKQFMQLAARGTADKWNPADIYAILKSDADQIITATEHFDTASQMPSYVTQRIDSSHKQIIRQNKKNAASASKTGRDNMQIQEELARLYDYNAFIDSLYAPGKRCIPISLKKANANPPIKIYRSKGEKGIKDALEFKLEITKVDYKPSAQKVIVNFKVWEPGPMGIGGRWDNKWFLDMRGFEKSAKIDDIQMQVQRTGSTANHGKITLNFYSLIVKESGGKRAVDVYQRVRNKIFGKTLPSASDHMMTPPTIFNDYVNKRAGDGEFNKRTLMQDAGKWAQYIQWLSKGRGLAVPTEQQVRNTEVMRMFRQKLGSTVGSTAKQMPKKAPGKRKEDWKKDKKGKHLPYEATQQDIIFASKFLKTKVQAAESGFIVDILRPTIKKEVKNNIMKSAYMYGASKGLRIFTTKGATEQLSASTYIKVGG